MRELRHECREIFRHWLIAVVAIAVVTAAGGALISAGDSVASRIVAAAIGAFLGLAVVAVGVVAIALIRMPLSVYRERHRLKFLGQECCDVVDEMLRSARFEKDRWGQIAFAESDPSSLAHYNTKLAARVYAAARELEKLDVIDRDQREKLAEPPKEVNGYVDRLQELLDLSNRLGAERSSNAPAFHVLEPPPADATMDPEPANE